jgi:hypothetical protein
VNYNYVFNVIDKFDVHNIHEQDVIDACDIWDVCEVGEVCNMHDGCDICGLLDLTDFLDDCISLTIVVPWMTTMSMSIS